MGLFGRNTDKQEALKQEYVSLYGDPQDASRTELPTGVDNDQPKYEKLVSQLKATGIKPTDGHGWVPVDKPRRG